jgi:signal transduction histidine kinase
MENEMKIELVFWAGTAIMIFLAIALISITLYYQNNIYKIKREEAQLLLEASLHSERMERKRIAADLHDGVLGDLGALRLYIALLSKSQDNNLIPGPEFIHFKRGIDDAIENTRLISYKLMPPLLESHGLVIALEDYLNRLGAKANTTFSIIAPYPVTLSSVYEYELFRIIQELCTNMISHGHATSCSIAFTADKGGVNVQVDDNGKPFDFKEMCTASKGNGMNNIRSRLSSINAVITQAKAEEGNSLLIKISA